MMLENVNHIVLPKEKIISQYPAVYAVGNEYQIIVPVDCETLMWCEVDGECYYDDFCGILRSARSVHKMAVPREALDRTRRYTICYRQVFNRKPYFSETGDVVRCDYEFRPLPAENIRIGMLADCHNLEKEPIAAIQSCGELDLLILNGDVPDNGGDIKCFTSIFKIAGQIGKGRIPVIFSRGNHDLRGTYAEKLEDFIPTDGGRTYFTFRLGPVWGIVIDCAEDKLDSSPEYGNTNACHAFRVRETEWLKTVIEHAGEEYNAPGVEYRLVISHMPFAEKNEQPFDIEEDLYGEWCSLLKKHVKPDLMLCGHVHEAYITMPGEEKDYLGQPCPIVVGSMLNYTKISENVYHPDYAGTRLELNGRRARVRFVHQEGKILLDQTLEL